MQLSKRFVAILPVAGLLLAACGTSHAAMSQSTAAAARAVSAGEQVQEVVKSPRAELESRTVQVRKVGPPCGDKVVKWIWAAGFRGQEIRVAWAIAQRESNGNPNESSYPDLGIVQLNSPSWSGTKYWPDNIYDPVQSFTAMRKMVRDMNWQPWGLRVKNGKVSYDFSSYGMWSSWQHQNWIVYPFEKYYDQFPGKCRKNL